MKLYFEDSGGENPPLLMVAGLASDAVSWLFQAPLLQAHFRLILCDNRGVGRSPKPPGPYSIAEMAQDILELLDDLGLQRLSMVGHSMGGAILQRLALDHPERVSQLVLACTSSHFGGRAMAVAESWAGCVRLKAEPALLGRVLFPWLYTSEFLDQPGNLDAAVASLALHPYPLDAQGLDGQVEALRGHDTRGRLQAIKAPTLVLGAEQDLLAPPSVCVSMADSIAGSRLVVLPNAGHSCMLQTPVAFNQALLNFLLEERTPHDLRATGLEP
ncbi:alpha/beta fold hydrolase [bacterium]|nr:alpha/beta fold hydrolase [bacterium]